MKNGYSVGKIQPKQWMNVGLKLSDEHWPVGSKIVWWEGSGNSNYKSDTVRWDRALPARRSLETWTSPKNCLFLSKLDSWAIGHQTGWNLDSRVTSTQGTSSQKRFFPNPKILLLILDELKNLGFRGTRRNHEIEGARAMDSLQGWR
jgi:hypothetical protein